MGRKSWYDAGAGRSVRVVPRAGSLSLSRRLHPRTAPGLWECLRYPLADGPGVGLLVFMPPVLLVFSLPLFDVIAVIAPLTRGNWALGLLALPILMPFLFCFAMIVGYGLLVLGQMFVASALGEPDHPRWPEWDRVEVAEGVVRWAWAGLFGAALGGFPMMLYWKSCGDVDWFDRLVFADLAALAVGYALMALSASLLHDSIVAANPVTVVQAVLRIGWDYLRPCLAGVVALGLAAGSLYAIFFLLPVQRLAFAALWGFWVLVFYEAMVVLRMLGLTYHAHAADLVWFTGRPKWGTPGRVGRLYTNS